MSSGPITLIQARLVIVNASVRLKVQVISGHFVPCWVGLDAQGGRTGTFTFSSASERSQSASNALGFTVGF